MIFGTSWEVKGALEKSRRLRLGNWHRYYPIFPRRLIDGRWVWFEEIERRINFSLSSIGRREYRQTPLDRKSPP